MIHVSWFPRENPAPSERRSYQVRDFRELVAFLGPPKPYKAKLGIPMFSPAEWPEGARKTKDLVQRVHFGVLDYDDIPEDDIAGLLARIDVPHLFTSSWSHGDPYKTQLAYEKMREERQRRRPTLQEAFLAGIPGYQDPEKPPLVRGRLLVPFSRPVEAAEWPRFWRALIKRFSWGRAVPDPKCGDSSHAYFYPAHPAHPPKAPIYLDASAAFH